MKKKKFKKAFEEGKCLIVFTFKGIPPAIGYKSVIKGPGVLEVMKRVGGDKYSAEHIWKLIKKGEAHVFYSGKDVYDAHMKYHKHRRLTDADL